MVETLFELKKVTYQVSALQFKGWFRKTDKLNFMIHYSSLAIQSMIGEIMTDYKRKGISPDRVLEILKLFNFKMDYYGNGSRK